MSQFSQHNNEAVYARYLLDHGSAIEQILLSITASIDSKVRKDYEYELTNILCEIERISDPYLLSLFDYKNGTFYA